MSTMAVTVFLNPKSFPDNNVRVFKSATLHIGNTLEVRYMQAGSTVSEGWPLHAIQSYRTEQEDTR